MTRIADPLDGFSYRLRSFNDQAKAIENLRILGFTLRYEFDRIRLRREIEQLRREVRQYLSVPVRFPNEPRQFAEAA
jgi:hypothetical protein